MPRTQSLSAEVLLDTCHRVLNDNRRCARQQAAKTFSDLFNILQPSSIRICRDVRDYEFYRHNIETHNANRQKFVLHMASRHRQLREKRLDLEHEYRDKYVSWKKKSDRLDLKSKRRKDLELPPPASTPSSSRLNPVADVQSPAVSILPSSRLSRRGNAGLAAFTSDSVKSEAEWQEVLAMIAATEGGPTSKETMQATLCASDPFMLIDPLEKKIFTFQNNNHMVINPVDRLLSNNETLDLKWSMKDRESFKLHIVQFGKNFPKIAEVLGTKSTQDCIEYYYRQKYVCGFKQLIRRGGQGRGVKRKTAGPIPKKSAFLSKDPDATVPTKTRASLLGRDSFRKRTISEMEINTESFGGNPSADGEGEEDGDESLSRKRPRLDDATNIYAPTSGKVRKRTAREKETTPASPPREDGVPISSDSNPARWDVDEKERALDGFARFGRDFDAVALFVGSKSATDCELFYDTYKSKLHLEYVTDTVESLKDSNTKRKNKALKRSERQEKSKSQLEGNYSERKKDKDLFEVGGGQNHSSALGVVFGDNDGDGTDAENAAETDLPVEAGHVPSLDDGEADDAKKSKKKKKRKAADSTHDTPAREEERALESRSPGPLRHNELLSPQQLPIKSKTVSYWSRAEKEEFIKAIQMYGRDWDQIARMIGSKSAVQSRNHYHNYRDRNNYDEIILAAGHQLKEEDAIGFSGGGDYRQEEDEEVVARHSEVEAKDARSVNRRSTASGLNPRTPLN
ncbi:nuclear receptor corepressor 2 [Dinochytrium kinnereticum]|nr:nuclear receptor corepressor 2 [Dinochytrium kinnereticum]